MEGPKPSSGSASTTTEASSPFMPMFEQFRAELDEHHDRRERVIKASRDARMLVVGCRGVGGFREMVLGSVSDQCVRYAACPVLVVRADRRLGADPR